MVGSCAWNIENYTCGRFTVGNTSEQTKEEESYLERHLFETGYLALDLAALKIHESCSKRNDIPLKIDSFGDFTNVSIGTDNIDEPMLVVELISLEKRVFFHN